MQRVRNTRQTDVRRDVRVPTKTQALQAALQWRLY